MDPAARGWDAYFSNAYANPLSSECSRLRDQIKPDGAAGASFGKKVSFQVTDINTGVPETTIVEGQDAAKDVDALLKDDTWRTSKGLRLISLACKRTLKPLEISSSLAATILDRYKVKPEFLRVLLSFGREPKESEARNSYISYQNGDNGESFFSYKLNYFEKNDEGMWTSRHIGVYHHHDSAGADLFILATSQPRTGFFETLVNLGLLQDEDDSDDSESTTSGVAVAAPDHRAARHLQANPAAFHAALLSCYVDMWREYLADLGEQFAGLGDKALGTNTRHQDDKTMPGYSARVLGKALGKETIDDVQTLRDLYDRSLFAGAACTSNVDIAAALVSHMPSPTLLTADSSRSLSSSADVLRSLSRSCTVLQEKIKNVTDLVGYTISFHQQVQTADLTARMASLTEENRDLTRQLRSLAEETGTMTRKLQGLTENTASDGAIVSVITVVSAVYLPGSFVATIFGMNFFSYNLDNNMINISPQFWIFIVLWVGFMLITVGVFVGVYHMKKADVSWPWKTLTGRAGGGGSGGTPLLGGGGGRGGGKV